MKTILRTYAKDLRNNCTEAERLLWRHLRKSQLQGVKFRRQQPIGPYIVDFVSFGSNLVVELDGSQHTENRDYDEVRDGFLRSNGFRVLRFWDNDVMRDPEAVVEKIWHHCVAGSPTP